MMSGIGEVLAPVAPLPQAGMVLVNPGVAVPTPAVFQARSGAFSAPAAIQAAGWADAAAMAASLRELGNDLQEPAISIAPVIGAVIDRLRDIPGCLLARMSGSGATCFGLFESALAATEAARSLTQPGWWVWGGGFFGGTRF